jgi:predicted anti-sigma-YlaC factor YlaD
MTPLTCNQVVTALSRQHDDEATPFRPEDLDDHVVSCSSCRHFSAALPQITTALEALPASEPSAQFATELLEKTRTGQRAAGGLADALRPVQLITCAVAFALGVGLTLQAIDDRKPPESLDVMTIANLAFDAVPADSAGAMALALLENSEVQP